MHLAMLKLGKLPITKANGYFFIMETHKFLFPVLKIYTKSLSSATLENLSLLCDYKLLLFLFTSTFKIDMYKGSGHSLLAECLPSMRKVLGP